MYGFAAGAHGLRRVEGGEAVQQLRRDGFCNLRSGERRHGRNDSGDAEGDAALHIAEDTLGEVKLVLLQGCEVELPGCRRIEQGVDKLAESAVGPGGDFGQVDVEHASVLAVEFFVEADAILHVRVLGVLERGSVFVCVLGEHIAGGNEDGELGLDVGEVVEEVICGAGVSLGVAANILGAVGHGVVQVHHHAEAAPEGKLEVVLVDEIVEVSALRPVLAEDGTCSKECCVVCHESKDLFARCVEIVTYRKRVGKL